MTGTRLHLCPLAAALLFALHSQIQTATAADLTPHALSNLPLAQAVMVTSCGDDTNDEGTLRKAIAIACTTHQPVVDMNGLQCSKITLKNDELAPTCGNLTVKGSPDGITIDAHGESRAFRLHDGSELRYLKIQNGHSFDIVGGGCVFSEGALHLNHVSIDQCEAETPAYYTARGGAVYAKSDVYIYSSKVTNSTAYSDRFEPAEGGGVWGGGVVVVETSEVSGNSTKSDASEASTGGGIFASRDAFISYSTLARNSASLGGALFVQGELFLGETTISDNSAVNGAAVYGDSEIDIYSCTIASNSVQSPSKVGGAFSQNGPVSIVSSIIAGSVSTQNGQSSVDVGAGVALTVSGEGNIIQNAQVTVSRDTLTFDPLLLPLANNGGPTPTRLFMSGSPALRKGTMSFGFQVDQRGFSRGSEGNIDIGAIQDTLFASDLEGAQENK